MNKLNIICFCLVGAAQGTRLQQRDPISQDYSRSIAALAAAFAAKSPSTAFSNAGTALRSQSRAMSAKMQVSRDELRPVFDQIDSDSDGLVSFSDILKGVQAGAFSSVADIDPAYFDTASPEYAADLQTWDFAGFVEAFPLLASLVGDAGEVAAAQKAEAAAAVALRNSEEKYGIDLINEAILGGATLSELLKAAKDPMTQGPMPPATQGATLEQCAAIVEETVLSMGNAAEAAKYINDMKGFFRNVKSRAQYGGESQAIAQVFEENRQAKIAELEAADKKYIDDTDPEKLYPFEKLDQMVIADLRQRLATLGR